MPTNLQITLLQLFEQAQRDPDTVPAVPLDEWQAGSDEWRLLDSFRAMAVGVQQRIQHLQQAEQQLREREEQYRSIFEATTDALFITNLEGIITEANPAACRMTDFDHHELLGRRISLIDPAHAQTHQDQTTLSGNAERPVFLLERGRITRKDKTRMVVEGHSTTFTYKGEPHLLGVVHDITEQVEAEQQSREREEQYRSIFEATYDGLAITSLEGYYVEVNPAFCQMYGYTREELIGLHASALTAQVSRSALIEALETDKARKGYQRRGFGLRKDRTIFSVDANSTPFTYRGQPHLLSVVRDITEQMEAEQQLREREEQYRSIFEATTDGILIVDLKDGRLVEMNPAACRISGYTREEALGQPINMSDDTQDPPVNALDIVRAGGLFQGKGLDRGKDGKSYYMEAHVSPFTYKGKPHMLEIVRDISEQVEAERQLREREALYRGIFETTYDGLMIFDLDGFVVEVNPASCQLWGYPYEEIIGMHGGTLVAPVSQAAFNEAMKLNRAGKTYQAVGRGLRKDGTIFPFDTQTSPITYQGQPHSLAAARDITEQVEARHLLEQRVQERTRELSTLLEVSHNVASTLELKPLLGLILEQLRAVVEYSGASINTLEEESLVIVEYRGFRPPEQMVGHRFPLKQAGLLWEMMLRSEPAIINDVLDDTPLARIYRGLVGGDLLSTSVDQIGAWMAVPLTLKEQVMGMVTFTARERGYFTTRHAALAQAITNQAAIAIANARLYEQAQALAALEERQKLARELHDSVSQALYGIALGAHSARTALQRDPEHVSEPLDYVLALAEAGLVEMRALIFELRPESLEQEGLVSALTKQGNALQARHELRVVLDLCDEPALTLAIKQELYRIAQEAMHNTVKHARARQVDLRLSQTNEAVLLEVRDDGLGFNPDGAFPGHLGLHSMRERVSHLGGMLQIESAPGNGTRIWVRVPLHPPI